MQLLRFEAFDTPLEYSDAKANTRDEKKKEHKTYQFQSR